MDVVEYNTVTVEAAKTGWIVREKGRPVEIFVRWDALVRHLESRMTSGKNAYINK